MSPELPHNTQMSVPLRCRHSKLVQHDSCPHSSSSLPHSAAHSSIAFLCATACHTLAAYEPPCAVGPSMTQRMHAGHVGCVSRQELAQTHCKCSVIANGSRHVMKRTLALQQSRVAVGATARSRCDAAFAIWNACHCRAAVPLSKSRVTHAPWALAVWCFRHCRFMHDAIAAGRSEHTLD